MTPATRRDALIDNVCDDCIHNRVCGYFSRYAQKPRRGAYICAYKDVGKTKASNFDILFR